MNRFVLHLQSATQYERVDDVESFVGEDASGSFGILAGHERCMTTLDYGLSRFRCADGAWRYLALPGALLRFVDNELSISTRLYRCDADVERIEVALREEILGGEEKLRGMKEGLQKLERAMLKRLWTMRADPREAL